MSEAGLDRAAWLAGDLLLLLVRSPGGDGGDGLALAASAAGRELPVELTVHGLAAASTEASAERLLVIARLIGRDATAGEAVSLALQVDGAALSIEPADLAARTTGPQELVREELSTLDPYARVAALAAIRGACAPRMLGPGGFSLAAVLGRLREELRPHMAQSVMGLDEPHTVHADLVMAIDERAFWIKGWMHDADGSATRLTAVSPEGGRVELLDRVFRHARPDIGHFYAAAVDGSGMRHGFAGFAELPTPSLLPNGWVVELHTSGGRAIEHGAPEVVRNVDAVRGTILSHLALEPPPGEELLAGQIHPALSRLQDRLERMVAVERVIELGDQPPAPGASVIVPLYTRIDYFEYQIAFFARDPEMAAADLIFVLDSPELADRLEQEARALHALHRLPFRIAVMNRNAGFAGANNAAAALARGRLLVLVNSDVFPDRPGWLGKMSAFHEATPDIGALGPKLLYEDESLQHAGMFFRREQESGLWGNQHYFKGLHRHFPPANVARAVPAVTGACLMIDRGLYEQAGGLPTAYVQGGYEDSDLCLRLSEMGRQNWYMPGAELYHLEAQSYPAAEHRQRVTRYNMWLQTRQWEERLAEVAAEHQGSEA